MKLENFYEAENFAKHFFIIYYCQITTDKTMSQHPRFICKLQLFGCFVFTKDAESIQKQEKLHLETGHEKQMNSIKNQLEQDRQDNHRNVLKLQQTIRYVKFNAYSYALVAQSQPQDKYRGSQPRAIKDQVLRPPSPKKVSGFWSSKSVRWCIFYFFYFFFCKRRTTWYMYMRRPNFPYTNCG